MSHHTQQKIHFLRGSGRTDFGLEGGGQWPPLEPPLLTERALTTADPTATPAAVVAI